MVAPAVDLLRNPLGAVRGLFSIAAMVASPAPAATLELSGGDWGIKGVFDKFLYEEGAIAQVPHIDDLAHDSIPSGSLVRFRGMIQDMFDVEYYVGAYKDCNTWQTNKYTDSPVPQDTEQQIWDRRLFYCVPIPGENQWMKNTWHSNAVQPDATSQSLKRKREDIPATVESMDCDSPTKEHNSCLVKIYDGNDADLKLNDIAEFVGIVWKESELVSISASDSSALAESLMEDDTSLQLPSSTVPRLHCITMRKLSAYSIPSQPGALADICSVRESLVCTLQSVLGEDRLAAEYLLLHLLSKVYSRVEPLAVGKFSLNFSGCQAGADGSVSLVASAVGHAISVLLPCSQVVPLSLEDLNSCLIAPRKDYATNRLVTGGLQLASGTHLTLDETALNTGRLNETGVKNLQSLKSVMESQKVDYDFQYYQMEMPTDLPVLVVSCGKSRILPADALVPLRCSAEAARIHAEASDLSKWRIYLSSAREADHVIEPSMQKIVEEDLVAARQKDRTVGSETFHRWLTMARLLSLSYSERSLTRERWEMMKELEMRCAARLRETTT
ncbi:mini-chromosome maintenance complex-binding protein isoform X2 [Selaginella moellendorffii]|uniref:mini-chromosome maintenance complex-binding protein isoform X2 n=1 Tax=Selaginella moellendorffii TaxID=88036 RepID=UPI000D1C7AE2|nr:mini-chromosome maintenance complex-binding protein isoform X2 [Selaginella moellendorffii]|eukprot:XP_024526898.1 mini-chromosome maintenance complex-binding protein isoform X2 [Selaginella moellendorffii]